MKTQVAIIGAGPAGLLLGRLLELSGIDSVILEARSRTHVEGRIRAGVLEQGAENTLREAGVGARMDREGLVHRGIEIALDGHRHRIDFEALTAKHVMVYGQHEVVKDLIAARVATGAPLLFEVADVAIEGIEGDAPAVHFTHQGSRRRLDCAIVAGCDGFHGVSRGTIPDDVLRLYERVYPFAWLGVLVEAPPAQNELVYASHPDGFALFSMRSPEITRLYVQCAADDDPADWPDDRVWAALHDRLEGDGGFRVREGPILQKGITAMRSFVAEPMRHGRLVLAGDAAHIVPPTGAKGMNLAVADVRTLHRALEAFFATGDTRGLETYSERCLKRIWTVQRFSWWMTAMLHKFPGRSAFDDRLQRAELDYVLSSNAAMTALAENYVGLPFPA